MNVWAQKEREFAIPLPFGSIQTLSGYHGACPRWLEWTSLFGVLHRMQTCEQ